MNDYLVTCELTSQNGNKVSLGDAIVVELPEVSRCMYHDDEGLYYSAKRLKAVLMLQLSRGLLLKVVEVLEIDDEDDDSDIKPGKVIPFRRCAWKWDAYSATTPSG
jgi:hypothetical protein